MAVHMITLKSPFKMSLYGYVIGQSKIQIIYQIEVWFLLQTGHVVSILASKSGRREFKSHPDR